MNQSVLQSIFKFEGRRSRKSYALTMLSLIVIGFAAAMLAIMLSFLSGTLSILMFTVIVIALSVASFTVGAQRIRDFDQSGCWVFLFLLPYVGFALMIALAFVPPTIGDNKYGPVPDQSHI
jgi:uncharacterized membrane protein YhaH (DUF805 family)